MRGKTGHEQQEYREQQRLAWLSEVEATSGRPMEELLGHPSYARDMNLTWLKRKRKQMRGQREGREDMNEPLEGVKHRAGQRARLRKEVAC